MTNKFHLHVRKASSFRNPKKMFPFWRARGNGLFNMALISMLSVFV